ncbi:EpsG family protein [Lacticaseibacillus sp. 866-1]|uniref:EpsG family protein n=1 Tax=Lacticaseibacillus sp. 866-1 TaxID=2799576 RepID=UPI0019434E74|nr:EpsG family protein [Lacticaseibacillus sp. 866-1]
MIWLLIVAISAASVITQKFERVAGFVAFLGIGYLCGTPNYAYDPDSNVYAFYYNNGVDYFERGYNLLARVCHPYMGYPTFRLLTSLAVFFGMYLVLLAFTRHMSTMALFYSIALFPADKAQTRNCMAVFFILLGALLLYKFGKKAVLPALVVIFIGSLFHSLALFFLLVPVLWLFKDFIEKYYSLIFWPWIFVGLMLEILGSGFLGQIIGQLVGMFSSRQNAAENITNVYSTDGPPLRQWLVLLGVTLIMMFIAAIMKQYINDDTHVFYQLFLIAALLWAIALVLTTMSIDYVRVLRVTAFFYFLLTTTIAYKQKGIQRATILGSGLLFSLVMMGVDLWVYGFSLVQILAIFGVI